MTSLTRSAILRISDQKTLELIDLFKKEECLWNTHSELYKDKVERAEAVERIADQLGLAHFDAYHAAIKFKNLRNSYCQELKKIGRSMSMSAGMNVYKPKVFWYAKMDSFLRPHLQKSRASSYMVEAFDEVSKESEESEGSEVVKQEPAGQEDFDQVEETEEVEEIEETEETEGTEEWIDKSSEVEEMIPSPASASSIEEGNPLVGQKRAKNSNKTRKRQKTEDHGCCDGNLSAQMVKSISSALEVLANPREDSFDTFGKYIASLLRNMPEQRALHLQPKIVSLVANAALMKNENRVSQSGQKS